MPDAAVAEPQIETAETQPQQQPHTAPIRPELQALMERVLPVGDEDGGSKTEDGGGEPETKEEPKGSDKPDATDKEPGKKSTLRLAPDLDRPEPDKPAGAAPAEEEVEITDEMIAAEKSPKKQADMRKFRDTLETLKRENASLKAAPAAKPADDAGLSAVVEQQKQMITDLSARLERADVQAHPMFQERFVQPLQRQRTQAAEVVKEAGADPVAFERALSLTGKNRIDELDKIVEGIDSNVLRARLERLIDGIDTSERDMAAALQDAKGLGERLSRDEKIARHQMHQQQEAQLKAMLGQATQNLAAGLEDEKGEKVKLEVLTKVGRKGYEWWDQQSDEIRETAEEILLKATPEKMTIAAVLAASCGAYRSLWQNTQQYAKDLESRLAGYEGAEPSLKDRRQPKPEANGEFAPDADIVQVALARLKRGDFKGAGAS